MPDPASGSINMAIHRLLTLTSMDFKSLSICVQSDGLGMTDGDVISNMVTDITDAAVAEYLAEKNKKASSGWESGPADGPELGAKHMEKLIQLDLDGGLAYYHALACRDARVTPPDCGSGCHGAILHPRLADPLPDTRYSVP